ncbi:MAG: hypothetical protein P4L64_13035 [Caulobacteraceae bacterium]|nr:hypothetical protein [Caulobacteraceae bacterium]
MLQLPPFTPGETIQFANSTTVHNASHGGSALDSGSSISFAIEVLQVDKGRARLRWILLDGAAWGPESSPGLTRWFKSLRGAPIEIVTDASGLPLDVANWSAISEEAAPETAEAAAAYPPLTRADLTSLMKRSFLTNGLTSDLVTMAAMQIRTPTLMGHTDLKSDQRPNLSIARTVDVKDPDPTTCAVSISRSTVQTFSFGGKPHPAMKLETSSVVSTADGWVISLHEVREQPNFIKTTDIRRLTPAPCPSIPASPVSPTPRGQ